MEMHPNSLIANNDFDNIMFDIVISIILLMV